MMKTCTTDKNLEILLRKEKGKNKRSENLFSFDGTLGASVGAPLIIGVAYFCNSV